MTKTRVRALIDPIIRQPPVQARSRSDEAACATGPVSHDESGGWVTGQGTRSAPPVVSVILPTYNRAHLLARSVGSVLGQSFDHWELLVVDDASEDAIEQVVRAFGDPRIRYLRRVSRGGVAAAQNTGLAHARAVYVAFLHSDDEFLPDKLAVQVEILNASSPQIGGVEGGLEIVEDGRLAYRPPYLERATAWDLLSYRAGVHISTLMLRREVAEAVRFDEALAGTEDRDFCIRLLAQTDLLFARAPLVRIHRSGPRLSTQPKAPIYRYLLGKYRARIVANRSVHAAWLFRIARAHRRVGDVREARLSLLQAVRVDPWRLRRWPLFLAGLAGDRVFRTTLDLYLLASQWRSRLP